MLIRGPVHSGRLTRRTGTEFSFQQDRAGAIAYESDEEAAWDEEASFDSDTPDGYQEDEYDESADDGAFASSDLYQSSYEDDASDNESAFDEDDDYALEQAADNEAEENEGGWDAN
ncbi:MAG TPA: hypothetical protein VF099_12080, partial [Ktedonobacterales bacterium]